LVNGLSSLHSPLHFFEFKQMNSLDIKLEADHSQVEKGILYLKCSLTIDGVSPLQNHDDDFDLCALFKSLKTDGSYLIFTCSCGIAGCAGYHEGVHVSIDKETINWKDLDFDKSYEFATSDFKNKVEQIYSELLNWRQQTILKNVDLKIWPDLYLSEDIIKAYREN
jgi:hypothetical protein